VTGAGASSRDRRLDARQNVQSCQPACALRCTRPARLDSSCPPTIRIGSAPLMTSLPPPQPNIETATGKSAHNAPPRADRLAPSCLVPVPARHFMIPVCLKTDGNVDRVPSARGHGDRLRRSTAGSVSIRTSGSFSWVRGVLPDVPPPVIGRIGASISHSHAKFTFAQKQSPLARASDKDFSQFAPLFQIRL
jgi:hypothetical protein